MSEQFLLRDQAECKKANGGCEDAPEWSEDFTNTAGQPLLPHTDGYVYGDHLPDLIALLVEASAEQGGENFLVDGEALLGGCSAPPMARRWQRWRIRLTSTLPSVCPPGASQQGARPSDLCFGGGKVVGYGGVECSEATRTRPVFNGRSKVAQHACSLSRSRTSLVDARCSECE